MFAWGRRLSASLDFPVALELEWKVPGNRGASRLLRAFFAAESRPFNVASQVKDLIPFI